MAPGGIIHYPLRRIRDKFFPEQRPPSGSFQGLKVLVTGATAGLGLAAAIQFVSLGAEVVITSRNDSTGQKAKHYIEEHTDVTGLGKVLVLELDMDRYSSCTSFVEALKQACPDGIDCAVLNAGCIFATFVESPQGWEQTIQVNSLSTSLLGLLLLKWMRETANKRRKTPHLVFSTSRAHLDADITDWAAWHLDNGILRNLSKSENFPEDSLMTNYHNSKLLLTYAVEEMCKQALDQDKKPEVIINTCCPGRVATDISRHIKGRSMMQQMLISFWAVVLAKSADYGARTYVNACLTSDDQHGKFLQTLYTDDEYERMAVSNLQSKRAMEVRPLVWKEIVDELKENASLCI